MLSARTIGISVSVATVFGIAIRIPAIASPAIRPEEISTPFWLALSERFFSCDEINPPRKIGTINEIGR